MIKIFSKNTILIIVPIIILGGIISYNLTIAKHFEEAKRQAIVRLSNTLTYPYAVKNGKIVYINEVLEDVDVVTFEIISAKGYAKDKNNVYLASSKIPGADPKSFEYLPDVDKDYPWGYARDKKSIFLNGHKLEDSDPKTFKLVKKDLTYGKDKNHVYLGMFLIKGADPETFQIVSVYTYSKDKKSVYFGTDTIPNSDPATFESIINTKGEAIYYKDKNNVYDPTLGIVAGANPITFQPLGSRYSRDDRLVFYSTTSIPVANLQTFISIGDDYAKDKNHLYHEGDIIFNFQGNPDPFEQAAKHMIGITPKGDAVINYIVNTFYDLTLFYGNYPQYNIFRIENKDKNDFFGQFFQGLKRSSFDLAEFVPFRLAFVAPNSPAASFDFPQPVGPGIGGEVVGRQLLDEATMLVYGKRGWQEYLGPSARMCKGQGDSIDKFIFKKINGEWKIWDIEKEIDSWVTNNEGDAKEECREINQDKIEKYRIGQ